MDSFNRYDIYFRLSPDNTDKMVYIPNIDFDECQKLRKEWKSKFRGDCMLIKHGEKLRNIDQKAIVQEIYDIINVYLKGNNISTIVEDSSNDNQAEVTNEYNSALDYLKTDAIPEQPVYVVLSAPGLKEKEIYAPDYNNGERVALVHYPYGSKFRIPALTVNNNYEAAKVINELSPHVVGINPKTAFILYGANFYCDTVLVIPIKDDEIELKLNI